MEDLSNIAPTLLDVAADIANTYERGSIQSISELTRVTRVCPICYVDKSLTYANDDSITNILQTMLAIYTAHYLQAVSLIQNINGINTLKLLDSMSTEQKIKKSEFFSGAKAWGDILGMNSYKLPDYSSLKYSAEDGDKITSNLNGQVNLSVGRIIEVEFRGTDKTTVKVPVEILLSPVVVSPATLPNLMLLVSEDDSYSARYHKWRSGEISSFMDYILARDIVDRDRKALLTDETGLYRKARENKTAGFFKSIVTRSHRYNIASAMSLVSKSTAENIELMMKGKLTSDSVRHRFFDTTGSMMLVVSDPTSERITLFLRGIDTPGIYTYRDFKDHGKKASGVDIESILKAYKLGERPML